ncbi:MAG: hypothetical protein DMD59_01465 [Gemmatimonadetes bacterium]|nr:MAG: hypothetical protein DMD59_01465 [Gemmatimonadota bacterium]
MHRAYSSVVLVLGLLACASSAQQAALGWSLGGEAHVFVSNDRFARDLYKDLTGSGRLTDSLGRRPLLAVDARRGRTATVLSASGAAPARLTLARFHAPETCGSPEIVTELVFAFPPGGAAGRSSPPSHVTVVALLRTAAFAGDAGTSSPAMSRTNALDLVSRVARRAESRATLIRPAALDPDRAADAGEVVPLRAPSAPRYAVGFRTRFVAAGGDTALVTGVAVTDPQLRAFHWVIRPLRSKLTGGMIHAPGPSRYSLRGAMTGEGGGTLLLLDEITDVSPRESRAMAVEAATRQVVTAQPLALRCP